MGAEQSCGITQRLLDVVVKKPTDIWALAVTDNNCVKVNFAPTSARQCQFASDLVFEIESMPKIAQNSGFFLLFQRTRIIKGTAECGNKTSKLTTQIQQNIGPYLDPVTKKPTGTTQFTVLWGDHIFNVSGVSGNLYLWWANVISMYQRDKHTGLMNAQISKFGDGLPLLIHTDGHFKVLHVCFLIVHQKNVRFVAPEQFKNPQQLDQWTPVFMHDTRRTSDSPRPVLLTEADILARRERQILPDGERRNFGKQHKTTRQHKTHEYDNTEFRDEEQEEEEEEEEENGNDEDDAYVQRHITGTTTIIEELGTEDMESTVMNSDVMSYFASALGNAEGDDGDGDDEEDNGFTTTDNQKSMGNELEWDEHVLVKQNVQRMAFQNQVHNDQQRKQRGSVMSSSLSVDPRKGKAEHDEDEDHDDLINTDLKFEGPGPMQTRMFQSTLVLDDAQSANLGIPRYEGGRTNQTYAPILKPQNKKK